MVEAPEDDAQFRFHLPTPEPLGRPVINIERVSFGYPKREPGASMDDEEGKKKKKKPAEGEGGGEEGKEEGDVVVPPVPVPMLLRPPVEMGKILFENVDFGVDLETRIGKEGGRVRIWCLPKSFGDGASSVFVSKCTLFPPSLQVSSAPMVPASPPSSTLSSTSFVPPKATSSDITTCGWRPLRSITGTSLICACLQWRILRPCFPKAINRYVAGFNFIVLLGGALAK